MTTALFLRSDSVDVRLPVSSISSSTSLNTDGNLPSQSFSPRRLHVSAGSSGILGGWGGIPTSPAPADPGTNGGNYPYAQGCSRPLSSAVTISGTISFDIWAYESNMSANAYLTALVWVVRPDGTSSLICNSTFGTELGTTSALKSWSATATSTNCYPGDVLHLALFISGSSQAAGYQVTIGSDGPDGGTYGSKITFTETLSFIDTDPSGTVTNFKSSLADFGSTPNKKLWTDAPSGTEVSYLKSPATFPGHNQWDIAYALNWNTPQLEAVTLEGYATFQVYCSSDANTSLSPLFVVYKTDADGSNPVQIGQGKPVDYVYSTTKTWLSGKIPIRGTLTNGQRLRVVLFTAMGGTLTTTGGSAYIYVENSSTPTRITWPATLTEYNATPPAHADDYWGVAC